MLERDQRNYTVFTSFKNNQLKNCFSAASNNIYYYIITILSIMHDQLIIIHTASSFQSSREQHKTRFIVSRKHV